MVRPTPPATWRHVQAHCWGAVPTDVSRVAARQRQPIANSFSGPLPYPSTSDCHVATRDCRFPLIRTGCRHQSQRADFACLERHLPISTSTFLFRPRCRAPAAPGLRPVPTRPAPIACSACGQGHTGVEAVSSKSQASAAFATSSVMPIGRVRRRRGGSRLNSSWLGIPSIVVPFDRSLASGGSAPLHRDGGSYFGAW